jgi:hypothetical protein
MSEDTVLQEVRSAREAFARSHGFNVRAMVGALRALDEAGDWPVVRLTPRLPEVAIGSMAGKDSKAEEGQETLEVPGPYPTDTGSH